MRSLVISIFLYAYESWTLTAESEKRTQAFELTCYRRLLNILYKSRVTNDEVRRKIPAAFGEYDGHLVLVKMEIKLVRSRLKDFWLSKDNPTGHSERKKKRRGRQKKRWEDNIILRVDLASSTRASENRPRGYKTFLCSTQLSMELFLPINVKIPTMVLAFRSGKIAF